MHILWKVRELSRYESWCDWLRDVRFTILRLKGLVGFEVCAGRRAFVLCKVEHIRQCCSPYFAANRPGGGLLLSESATCANPEFYRLNSMQLNEQQPSTSSYGIYSNYRFICSWHQVRPVLAVSMPSYKMLLCISKARSSFCIKTYCNLQYPKRLRIGLTDCVT